MNGRSLFRSSVILLLLGVPAPVALAANGAAAKASAESPIPALYQSRSYAEVLREAEQRASKLTLADRLAAAKSAWALGLPDRARQYWKEALGQPNFTGIERSREEFGLAVLEIQEGNSNEALKLAERAARRLEPSPLRAQLWMVAGEALRAQNALRQASEYFERAVEEATGETKAEALYQLGEVELKSGLIDLARVSYTAIDSHSPFSARALRRLAEIDLGQQRYEEVITWIGEGRENFPAEFFDSWSFYAIGVSSLSLGRPGDAQAELERQRVRFSENDPWYALALASFEAHAARAKLKEPADAVRIGAPPPVAESLPPQTAPPPRKERSKR